MTSEKLRNELSSAHRNVIFSVLTPSALKQLEVIQGEEMPNLTKARVAGLLGTEKEALHIMDETLAAREKYLWVAGACGAGVLGAGFVFLLLRVRGGNRTVTA